MTKKERYKLAKIVFDFVELRTRLNSPADGDLVANDATDRFKEIRTKFKLKPELIEIIEDSYSLDEEDKEFLKDYVSS